MTFDPNTGLNIAGHKTAYTSDGAAVTSPANPTTVYANSAAIVAVATTDAARVDGTTIEKIDDYSKWTYEAASTASADAWHIIPTTQAGSVGAWVRRNPSLADLNSVVAGLGPDLLGDRGTGRYLTAATRTASFNVTLDVLEIVNATNTAATATLPAISATNDGHKASIFNAGTTAAVFTPASGDCCGGTAASNATVAGPAAGVMKTLVANLATRRWIPLA